MNRLLGVVAGLVLGGVAVAGEPPSGVERTYLEQEFYLPEQPRPTPRGLVVPQRMPAPTEPKSVQVNVRSWLARVMAGQLGVSPLTRPEMW